MVDAEYALAKTLLRIIMENTKMIKRQPSVDKWADDFRKLHIIDRIPIEGIQTTLDWYAKHIGEKYVPQAYSASGFRKKYVAMVAAMGRDSNGPQRNVTITKAVGRVQSRLGGLVWPGDEKKDEAIVIQQSLDNHDEFRVKLGSFFGKSCMSACRAAPYVLDKMGHAECFVETWMRSIHNMAWRWTEWHGNLLSFIWHPRHKIFQSTARGWMAEWCGMTGEWDELLKVLDENTSV